MDKIQFFLQQFKDWSIKQENILGVVLVGSYANNAAKENSDIDLMIIVKDLKLYLQDNSWIDKFGEVKQYGIKDEDWGLVKTKRVFYRNGIEVEFNFSNEEWTKINPVDVGTKKVMKNGYNIMVDKNDLLNRLADLI